MVARRVDPAHGTGRPERHVHDLVAHLARSGVPVELYAETPDDPARAVAAAAGFPEGVTVHWIPGRWLPVGARSGATVVDRLTNFPAWSLRAARWIVREAQQGGWYADVVHVHGLAGWGLARAAGRGALPTPLVVTLHGLEELLTPTGLDRAAYAPLRYWTGQVVAAADRVAVAEPVVADAVRRYLEVAGDRLVTMPIAVDPERCRRSADRQAARAWLERHGLGRPRPLLVSAGRVVRSGSFEVLVGALARAADRLGESWAWVLAGDGPGMPRVETAVAGTAVADRCRLARGLSEECVHGLLSLADWFVVPTTAAGSSPAALEAMAHGTAVVACEPGGVDDAVEDGVSGLLVPAGDIDALAGALRRAGSADAGEMGDAGRAVVERRFSWRAVLPGVVAIYTELAARPRGVEP